MDSCTQMPPFVFMRRRIGSPALWTIAGAMVAYGVCHSDVPKSTNIRGAFDHYLAVDRGQLGARLSCVQNPDFPQRNNHKRVLQLLLFQYN